MKFLPEVFRTKEPDFRFTHTQSEELLEQLKDVGLTVFPQPVYDSYKIACRDIFVDLHSTLKCTTCLNL